MIMDYGEKMDVIFDMDGTLMDIEHRRHFVTGKKKDWKSFEASENVMNDEWNDEIFKIAIALKEAGHRIIISSGRTMSQKEDTVTQIETYPLEYDAIYMREDGDWRPDTEVKREFLDKMRADGFNPVMAVDDRQSVVDMFRENGLRVLQVDVGDF